MEIVVQERETFVLLNGITVQSDIQLSQGIQFQPADTSHLDFKSALSACSRPDDIAVMAAFIPRITSQFRISSSTPHETAVIAWNSSWDALLLAAIFQTEIGFNLQSNVTSVEISSNSVLRAIHRNMSGFHDKEPYLVTEEDVIWITKYYSSACALLDNDRFQTAVQCSACQLTIGIQIQESN